jgi:RNA polymerase sigma-70 factor, ECF subfamily
VETWASSRLSEAREPQDPASGLPARLRGVFERDSAFVYRCLCYLRVREADLDEALAQVFSVVGQELNARDAGCTRGWLYGVCRHVARGRALATPDLLHETVPVKQREALAFGQRLLRLLTPEQREVFMLYEVEDMPTSEIARALSCPVRSVRAQLREARERIVAEVERIAAESADV